MKPRLFIGSSSEALPIAGKIRELLGNDVECHIWNRTFNLGDSTLDSLRRQVLLADFALLIVTPDDPISKRGEQGYSPRDNVLFELGLFMGALGPKKCFYLVVTDKRKGDSREVLILSDLDGITRLGLEIREGNHDAELQAQCAALKAAIERKSRNLELSVLPSTSLAIGYFRNFVMQVCKAFARTSRFTVGNQEFDLTTGAYDFWIVLPDAVNKASHAGYHEFARSRGLVEVAIVGDDQARPFPFFVSTIVEEGRLQMFDYPTTLRAAYDAVAIAGGNNLSDEEQAMLEERETRNFESTLLTLLENADAAGFKRRVHIISESELPAEKKQAAGTRNRK
ncbi:MAG: nucleotide-binding protein [Bacteroidetes bacterium]|nr:nucleotide-binding protein [Bacteroidota bacterium]